jgi:Nucleotidyltransferase domain
VSDPSARLRSLARRLAGAYLAWTEPHAILLVGSAGRGDADNYSDLDLLLYYDELPSEEALGAACREIGGERYSRTAWPDDTGISERYYLDGVQCQLGHVTITGFKDEIEKLVVELSVDEELPKIMAGLFEGLPLHGGHVIEGWRRDAAYTGSLQRGDDREALELLSLVVLPGEAEGEGRHGLALRRLGPVDLQAPRCAFRAQSALLLILRVQARGRVRLPARDRTGESGGQAGGALHAA